MKKAKKIVGIVLAVLLMFSGVVHFVKPEVFFPLTPDFASKYLLNYLAGGAEVAFGVGVFVPSLRKLSLFGICLLMVAFLPVHIWDAMKDEPFIGSKPVAYGRVVMQVFLIYLPLWARRS